MFPSPSKSPRTNGAKKASGMWIAPSVKLLRGVSPMLWNHPYSRVSENWTW
jgi:hypothetical protein